MLFSDFTKGDTWVVNVETLSKTTMTGRNTIAIIVFNTIKYRAMFMGRYPISE